MTLFDLRHFCESHVPWWSPLIVAASIIAIVLYVMWRAGR
jgi:hypothetical protein